VLVHDDSHLREKSSVYGGSSKALAAAKKRAGLSSDTDVIEIALERLALED